MNSRHQHSVVLLVILCLPCVSSGQDPVSFQRDVRPILSNHCFACHGTDAESRAADLRLDQRSSALESGAIVPGRPDESPLIDRIHSTDDAEIMPPAETQKPLTEQQREILRRWISQGADYEAHWAFSPLQTPLVPSTESDPWCRNPIDAFVLRKLQQSGLNPSPAADRATLVRRLYQDLLGLLPTPDEADAFLNDSSPDAWEKLVDRLLDSPHYGERWGRHWLDQARYADSNGYTIDGPRVMWPYRDWVISALNRDLPFDQFTIEQLAGDLLPEPALSQLVATAFHRNTMINQEGGVKPDQFRHEALIDRVNTTGAVWLGLTVGCAQCHSHKYDPISHEEYYQLYAFFNAAADANNVSRTVEVRQEQMFGWSDQQQKDLDELTALQKELQSLEKSASNSAPLNTLKWDWQQAEVLSVGASASSILKILPDGTLLTRTQPDAKDTLSVRLATPEQPSDPQKITGVRLRLLTHPDLPSNGPGTASNGNLVLTEILLQSGLDEHHFSLAWADHSQPGYAVAGAVDRDPKSGWAINISGQDRERGIRMNAPHEAIFALSKPVAATESAVSVVLKHELNENYLTGHFALDLSTSTAALEMGETSSAARLAEVQHRIEELQAMLPGKGEAVRQMVMSDQANPPETWLLERGDFLSPDRERGALQPAVPTAVAGSTEPGPFRNRLDLANWLVSPENPLTARVTANRIWGQYFGRGLVETENDFGFQGSVPSHPDLLNWLASEFRRNNWSLKQLHRTIVLSATYRQTSSLQNTDAIKADPENYLLGRQSRFRVEAEIVRDLALSASGLLNPRIGGPPTHLPQPEGVYNFTQNRKSWPVPDGPERFRRTMYVMFYRSAPYPLLSTFDAPDFSTVCTRREKSNTPLQSLTMANDEVFTELADGIAARVLQQSSLQSDADRCRALFRLCLTRQPQDQEITVLLNHHSRALSRFVSSAEDAAAVLSRPIEGVDAPQQAAWLSVARVLLNTDEFLTRN